MIQAKRLVEKKGKGEFEIFRYHVKEVHDIKEEELAEVLYSPDFDDPENSFEAGATTDFYNKFFLLDIEKFTSWIDDYCERMKDEDPEDIHQDFDKLKEMRKKLEKYIGYYFVIEELEEPEEDG